MYICITIVRASTASQLRTSDRKIFIFHTNQNDDGRWNQNTFFVDNDDDYHKNNNDETTTTT